MQNSDAVWNIVEKKSAEFFALSDRIWDIPETNYQEYRSAEEHAQMLESQGFRVERGIAGLPTAVMGEAGEDGPVIAILGEFDALPGLSQEAGVAQERPLVDGGNGHGCGHNMLGAGSMLAAAAVKDFLAENGLKGRVRYYGCPAEEGGSSKGFMVRSGVFDDVDIAISWHPAAFAGVNNPISLACNEINFHFSGRASHASATPHLGRSALDAVELMNVGVNYMREHIPSDARIHYALIDAGGIAPNVVQANATVRYLIRSPDLPGLTPLVERVKKVAQGAALMTETTVEASTLSAVSNLVPNTPLEAAMRRHLEVLGPPPFDAADRAFASAIQATYGPEEVAHALAPFEAAGLIEGPLCEALVPAAARRASMSASTDVGDVSWVVPPVRRWGATYASGTPLHPWQMVAQGKSPAAHKGMVHAAKVMAAVAQQAFAEPELIAEAGRDFARRTAKVPYVCPLPEETQPPLDM